LNRPHLGSATSAADGVGHAFHPAIFDRHVLARDIPSFLQTVAEADHKVRECVGGPSAEIPDHRHRRLLRPRRERPRNHRAAEQRDEIAPISFDHLVGQREQLVGNGQAERLGC
jgi:hypothetical protein